MSSKKVKRHPTIEDEVLIGTGTKILGDITIGARTKIGCNLVIKHDIPKDMVIHRITGDAPRDMLIGPMWSLNKWEVLNAIDQEMERRDSWQGCKLEVAQ